MKHNFITSNAMTPALVTGLFNTGLFVAGLFTLGMVTPACAEWVDLVADGMLEFHSDSNINRSAFTVDERDDNVASAQLSAGRYFQFNPDGARYTRLRLTADLELRAHDEFDGLDRTNIG